MCSTEYGFGESLSWISKAELSLLFQNSMILLYDLRTGILVLIIHAYFISGFFFNVCKEQCKHTWFVLVLLITHNIYLSKLFSNILCFPSPTTYNRENHGMEFPEDSGFSLVWIFQTSLPNCPQWASMLVVLYATIHCKRDALVNISMS